MSTVTLVLTASAFSVNPTWTLEQFHQALIASISSATTSSNVVLGQIGGSAPASNIGPWMKDSITWYGHNGSAYVPATIKVGDATYQITLAGVPTANRTITLPDATGTLALTSDVNRASVAPTVSATTTVDWSLSDSFGIPLDKNITISNVNSLPGQEISIAVYNPAAAVWTVTWTDVQWSGGTPVQSTDNKLDIYYIKNIGGFKYGRYLQNFV